MSMSKKDFIALADVIKEAEKIGYPFSQSNIGLLADFCQYQNNNFMRGRWLDYIAGKCGKNGGKVKERKVYFAPCSND